MLSNTKIKQAKSRTKQYKLYDARGLFIIVTPKGGRWWRFKYLFGGKQKTISLGVYPAVSLSQARARRDEARQKLATGIDPSATRKSKKSDIFEAVTREWHRLHTPTWNVDHAKWILHRLERDAVKAAYNYAEYLPERKKMMQEWADYLDKLKAGAGTIPIHRSA